MGIFSFLKRNTDTLSRSIKWSEFGSGLTNTYTTEDNDLYYTIVKRVATDVSTVTVNQHKKDKTLNTSDLLSVLNRPNRLDSLSNLLYRTVFKYYNSGNAFLLLDYDDNNKLRAIYPIDYSGVEVLKDTNSENNVIYFRFYMPDGDNLVLPDYMVIHLRANDSDNVLAENQNNKLNNIYNLIGKSQEALTTSINSNGKISGIFSVDASIDGEKLKDKKDNWVSNYLSADNTSGVVATSKMENFTKIDMNYNYLKTEEEELLESKVYRFFGVNKNILTGNYTDTEWSNYVGNVLNPLINMLEQELNFKLFTEKELRTQNYITISTAPLLSTNLISKANYYKSMISIGAFSPNDVRAMEGLSPIPNLDIYSITAGGTGIQVTPDGVSLTDNSIIGEGSTPPDEEVKK